MHPEADRGRPLLEAAGLSACPPGEPLIEDVAFVAEAAAVTAIVGPAGGGKTTLIDTLAGLVPVRQGEIRFDGTGITRRSAAERSLAGLVAVPNGAAVLPGRSLFHAVAASFALARRPASAWLLSPWSAAGEKGRQEVARVLDKVELGPFADHPVNGLPLAQGRRLRLAQALACRPRLLLLDRPWRGFGRQERQAHAALLRSLCDDGLTVVLVEDDLETIVELADHVVVLDRGRTVAAGSASEVGNAAAVRRAFAGPESRP